MEWTKVILLCLHVCCSLQQQIVPEHRLDVDDAIRNQELLERAMPEIRQLTQDTMEKTSADIAALKQELADLKKKVDRAHDCLGLLHRGYNVSGVYTVYPCGGGTYRALCDMDGGWTVIQNRQNGDVDFYRHWVEYKVGFGDLLGNFWLGNDKLNLLTMFPSTLRIEIEAWNGLVGYAEYSDFHIAEEASNYRIHVQGFSGNISDNMAYTNRMQFSTLDRDNDKWPGGDCAADRHSAWWYRDCAPSNLNGRYGEDNGDDRSAMAWKYLFDVRHHVPIKKSRMLVRSNG